MNDTCSTKLSYEAKDERSFTTLIAMQRLEIALVQLSYIKLPGDGNKREPDMD